MEARAAVQVADRQIEMWTLPVPDGLGDDEALLAIEGNGMCGSDWDQYNGGIGQRGLACVVAAREAGAARIIVAGRGLRPWKLDLALELGATHVINTDEHAVADVVRAVTDGEMVDRAIDTSPNMAKPVEDCIASLRAEGTLVLTATKVEAVSGFVEQIIGKALTVRGAYSVSEWAKRQAIRVLTAGKYDLSGLHTHTLSIDELDRAMRILGGEEPGEQALHITVTPR